MKRAHLYGLVGVLAVAGVGAFLIKAAVLGLPLAPDERADVWRVEAAIRFRTGGGPVKLAIQSAADVAPMQIVTQYYVAPRFGIVSEPRGSNVRIVYSSRDAPGEHIAYYRAVVTRRGATDQTAREPVPPPVAVELSGMEKAAAESLLGEALPASADARTLAAYLLKQLGDVRPGSPAALLLAGREGSGAVAEVMVRLLGAAGYPARQVHGVRLGREYGETTFVHWIEVFQDGRWLAVHRADDASAARDLLMPWWRGRAPFVEIEGGTVTDRTVTVSRSSDLSMRLARSDLRALEVQLADYSLFGLPLHAQELMRTMVMVPVGILLLVLLRNIVGIKTFGTFMPVLIALAFRQTGLAWGVLFFCIVVALGLSVRFYLDRLRLLLVPRLAAGVIVVVMILAGLTVLCYKLGIARGLSLGLFPIVILTMTIERMSVVWEEMGPQEAVQQAAGSLVVGAIAYFLMNIAALQHLLFVFPELLLAVLAAVILIGRYTGYRLLELPRFARLLR